MDFIQIDQTTFVAVDAITGIHRDGTKVVISTAHHVYEMDAFGDDDANELIAKVANYLNVIEDISVI